MTLPQCQFCIWVLCLPGNFRSNYETIQKKNRESTIGGQQQIAEHKFHLQRLPLLSSDQSQSHLRMWPSVPRCFILSREARSLIFFLTRTTPFFFFLMKDTRSKFLNIVQVKQKTNLCEFPGGPVVRTPLPLHCQGPRFNPGLGN